MIRYATEDTIAYCAMLEAECFRGPWPESTFRRFLDNPFYRILLAEDEEGNPLGYCIYSVVCDTCEVMRLCVSVKARRQGIGGQLLSFLIKDATVDGVSSVFLDVRAGNAGAIALYEKHGFRRIAVRKKYYENTEDAIVMELRMNG